jgi:hypothetical protein
VYNDFSEFKEIQLMKSIDQGDTWTPQLTVVPSSSSVLSRITVIDTDSKENVFIVYAQGTEDDKDIFLIKSTDAGATWSSPIQVNDVSTGDQRMPEMYIGQNDVIHIAWLDAQVDGKQHYYYSFSTDGGETFAPAERVTERGFDQEFVRPGDYFCMRQAPNGDMCMVWTDGRNGENHDIYFARQGLYRLPVWAIITISGVSMGIIALAILMIVRRQKYKTK